MGQQKLEKSQEKQFSIFSEQPIKAEIWIEGFLRTIIDVEFVEQESEQIFTLIKDEETIPKRRIDLYIKLDNKDAGCQMIFYTKTVYVNQTGIPQLEIFRLESQTAHCIPQQPQWGNILISSDDSKVFVAVDKENRSEVFNVQASGISGKISIKNRMIESTEELKMNPGIDLVYHTSMSLVCQRYYIYTKIITIQPMFILINEIDDEEIPPLIFAQCCNEEVINIIKKGERSIFKWTNIDQLREIQVKPENKERENGEMIEYEWSTKFVISGIGSFGIRCKP